MSKVEKEVKGITPLLQQLLIGQTSKVIEPLNSVPNDFYSAWIRLRNLIIVSPDSIYKKLKPEMERIQKRINKLAGSESIHAYLAIMKRRMKLNDILHTEVLELFSKVMREYYAGPYLEAYIMITKGKEIGL